MTASNTGIHIFLVLSLSCVSYLASHAAALSFNYSGSSDYPGLISRRDAPLAINTTAGISSVLAAGLCYCEAWPRGSDAGHVLFNIGEVDSSTSFDRNYYVSVGGQSSALFALKQLVNCSTDLAFLIVQAFQENSFELGLSCSGGSLGGLELRSLPGYTSTRGIGRVPRSQSYRALYSHRLRDQPTARRLLSSTYELNATTQPRQVASSWIEQVFVAGSALVGLICAVAGLLLCCIRIKRPRQKISDIELEEDDDEIIMEHDFRHGVGPRRFRYGELAAATDNFAAKRKIGRGGFGPVYRGYLSEEGRHVAIKALSKELSVQGLKEFHAEVAIMPQLRHRYVVRLVGWCARRRGLALVYELMPGGSLDTHLYSPDRHLTWPERYKIALQLGSALRYLHTECDQCVVHGDIKPANVMLDASGNAKLGDFGLARLVNHGAEPQTTQVVAGTVGYIDPEFVSSRRPSAESDVYSFGVVLLEIACGRRPTTSRRSDQAASAALLASVRDMYRRNVILEAADRRLDGEFDRMQMERLLVTGLWCAHHYPVQRPSVAQALDVLRSEGAELPVLVTMGDSGEILALEGQAYGDLSDESSAYLDESDETAYLTTEDSTYLLQM
nr:L-type lectin-domain containing receptor kinase IX.1-like isoform X3 [Lolium perenne]XP_051186884.1 L-type lectin-domain containing receptor kinase IX.1-like isoform X3 [Lolium perenne]XP_051186886.1 L-type lectin-domain containing receptor kinase IX.1-like isoform X3 [Lolium perenne]